MNLCEVLDELAKPTRNKKFIILTRDDGTVLHGVLHEAGEDYLLIHVFAKGEGSTPECHFIPRERIRSIQA